MRIADEAVIIIIPAVQEKLHRSWKIIIFCYIQ